MAIDTNIQSFTDAEMLLAVRHQIMCILFGGQRVQSKAGMGLDRASLAELRAMEADYQNRVAGSTGDGGIALVERGERY